MLYQIPNPHGGDLYGCPAALDFSANTNPLGTPDSVRAAVAGCLDKLHQYPDPHCRELVQAIARFEEVPAEAVLCGGGAAELIFSFCQAARPRRALELAPTFSEYANGVAAAGGTVERWPLSPENGFLLEESFLSRLEAGGLDAVFLCNPNNPTGRMIPPLLLERIAALCQEKKIRLFVDECFLDLADPGRAAGLKGRLEAQPGLFILKAFTKSYGMAGLRLGYGLSADRQLLTAMGRTVQPWNVSIPAQTAGAAALGETAFVEDARQLIRRERRRLQEQLAALGLKVIPSAANYLLLYSPRPLEKGLRRRGILIRDCSNYSGLGPGWYRVAVRRREENQALTDALKQLWEEES